MNNPNIERDANGVERCRLVVEKTVFNNPKNPAEGSKRVQAYCNSPVTLDVTEGRKVCPNCFKRPPVGNVHPRVTNSADTPLTSGELKELGLTEDPSLKPAAVVKPVRQRKPREAKEKAVEAKVSKAKKDAVSIEVDLSTLEGAEDVAALLIKKASEGLDQLPVTNFAESKRLIRIQEKLEGLLRA